VKVLDLIPACPAGVVNPIPAHPSIISIKVAKAAGRSAKQVLRVSRFTPTHVGT